MKTLSVGDTLYSLNVGNAHRRGDDHVLTPVVVRKIGRKYFEASPYGWDSNPTKYRLDDWREVTEYTANSELYSSPQEWEDQKERDALWRSIREFFSPYGRPRASLETLRHIRDILK